MVPERAQKSLLAKGNKKIYDALNNRTFWILISVDRKSTPGLAENIRVHHGKINPNFAVILDFEDYSERAHLLLSISRFDFRTPVCETFRPEVPPSKNRIVRSLSACHRRKKVNW
jgi:hypothetical protein